MTDRRTRRHKKDIETHLPIEVIKARKAEAKLKKASRRKENPEARFDRSELHDDGEELIPERGLRSPRSSGRETSSPGAGRSSAADPGFREGFVISVRRAMCSAVIDGQVEACVLPPELATVQQTAIAVGDRVLTSTDGNVVSVEEVLPRRTTLSRPDPHRAGLERVIAANVDLAVHVVSVGTPPLKETLIDRFWIAIARGGAEPLVVVNKIDMLTAESDELKRLATYRRLGLGFVHCSVKTGAGIEELRQRLHGKVTVFVGHSGVGKSSLINALDSTLLIKTREVSEGRGTGRHTTTSSTLHTLGENSYVIDTPGIREFGLWEVDTETLRAAFPDLEERAIECRFRNCSHSHEPQCAVKVAVEDGRINGDRYQSYLRLLTEINL